MPCQTQGVHGARKPQILLGHNFNDTGLCASKYGLLTNTTMTTYILVEENTVQHT
jgi:hypothetical protein